MAGVPITAAGLRKLKDELKHLQTVERPKISKEIEVARGHGDLKENAEYHAAKEKQGHIEGRIMMLNDWIARADSFQDAAHDAVSNLADKIQQTGLLPKVPPSASTI